MSSKLPSCSDEKVSALMSACISEMGIIELFPGLVFPSHNDVVSNALDKSGVSA